MKFVKGTFLESEKVQRWLYRTSLIVVMVLFFGFCAVVPIDAISQTSRSASNYALNTFVVVGALVLFGVVAGLISSARIYALKVAMQDIPKRYVPLDNNDLPKTSLRIIHENFERCEKIRQKAMCVRESVNHPGLSSPSSHLLPPLLPFDDVVKSVGMRLKWTRNSIGNEFSVPKSMSFREIIAHLERHNIADSCELNRKFVELYEEFRYSGKLITEEKFITFMEYSIDFVKITRMVLNNDEESGQGDGDDVLRKARNGSFLYTPSEISRSTFDALSSYSIRNRSSNNFRASKTYASSQGAADLYDDIFDLPPDEETNVFDDQLYRPATIESISSSATTNRHYGRRKKIR